MVRLNWRPKAFLAKSLMNKIGNTSIGNVIVEMTEQQYNALLLITQAGASPTAAPSAKRPKDHAMTHAEKLEYVKPRLDKLTPKKRDTVVRSIETMFKLTGGISSAEVDALIKALQKSGYFTIATNGKVAYRV